MKRIHAALLLSLLSYQRFAFVTIGKPVNLLVLAGALNGLILPIALGSLLIGAYKKNIVGDYRHPIWLTIPGVLVVIVMAVMGGYTLINEIPKLWG